MTAFSESAKQIVRVINWHGTYGQRDLEWRHHGLGMLQAEISDTLRVHVWHPNLVSRYMEWPRCVHDHRFDITSAVVVGKVFDVPCLVQPIDNDVYRRVNAKCYELQHAKVMLGQESSELPATHSKHLFDCAVEASGELCYAAGEEYRIDRRRFHTTRVRDLAITVIHRSNFDDRLARVLCAPDANVDAVSGIVRDDSLQHQTLVTWVLREAEDAAKRL